jgi:hypothetical protein
VVRPGFRGRSGASKLGCLVALALFVGALVYGSRVGRIYYRYYSLVDDMKQAARFAQTTTDEAIRANLVYNIDQLAIPTEAKRRLVISRTETPQRILIRTEYRETFELPFVEPRIIVLRPKVEAGF